MNKRRAQFKFSTSLNDGLNTKTKKVKKASKTNKNEPKKERKISKNSLGQRRRSNANNSKASRAGQRSKNDPKSLKEIQRNNQRRRRRSSLIEFNNFATTYDQGMEFSNFNVDSIHSTESKPQGLNSTISDSLSSSIRRSGGPNSTNLDNDYSSLIYRDGKMSGYKTVSNSELEKESTIMGSRSTQRRSIKPFTLSGEAKKSALDENQVNEFVTSENKVYENFRDSMWEIYQIEGFERDSYDSIRQISQRDPYKSIELLRALITFFHKEVERQAKDREADRDKVEKIIARFAELFERAQRIMEDSVINKMEAIEKMVKGKESVRTVNQAQQNVMLKGLAEK